MWLIGVEGWSLTKWNFSSKVNLKLKIRLHYTTWVHVRLSVSPSAPYSRRKSVISGNHLYTAMVSGSVFSHVCCTERRRKGGRTEGQRGTEREKRGQIRKEQRHLKEGAAVFGMRAAYQQGGLQGHNKAAWTTSTRLRLCYSLWSHHWPQNSDAGFELRVQTAALLLKISTLTRLLICSSSLKQAAKVFWIKEVWGTSLIADSHLISWLWTWLWKWDLWLFFYMLLILILILLIHSGSYWILVPSLD